MDLGVLSSVHQGLCYCGASRFRRPYVVGIIHQETSLFEMALWEALRGLVGRQSDEGTSRIHLTIASMSLRKMHQLVAQFAVLLDRAEA